MRALHFVFQYFQSKVSTSPAAAPMTGEELEKRNRQRVLTFSSLLSVVWATVLIDTLILIIAAATVWAVGGYLRLPLIPFAVLALAGAVATIWACVSVAVLAYNAETDPAHNSPNSTSWKQLSGEDDDVTTTGA